MTELPAPASNNQLITTQTIGEYLLRRLEEAGVAEVFGVPGDYNLQLMQQLEDRGRPRWIGCCNELNASYAADGYARLTGLGALVVTYGVGALSALNGIAGAYSEHVPVICICGSLPRSSIVRREMMHHTLADGGRDAFLRIFEQVTVAQAQLTPQNAAAEIDRLITVAWRSKRPVYVEIPSDLSYLEIAVGRDPLTRHLGDCDEERLRTCASSILDRLDAALRPAILLDVDAERFGVLDLIERLAGAHEIPVATMATTKGCFPEQSALFAGSYAGAASAPSVRDTVEQADCLITIGYRRVDSTSGFFTDRLPDNLIALRDDSADVSGEHYQAIMLKPLLAALTSAGPTRDQPKSNSKVSAPTTPPGMKAGDEPLTQQQFWSLMQGFVRPGDVIIAEDGTSSSGAGALHLPDKCTFITQAVWGSIGYSLGSLLGTLLAAPHRRHLLFIGDGSFQLTAQELSTILRHDLNPIIFLINNGGYTIERTILGATAKYNDVANWRYADLPETLSRTSVRARVVTTSAQLQALLDEPDDSFLFVELVMDPQDAPPGLITGGHASAELDYGPRGPQHRVGIQIAEPRGQ